MLLKGKLEKVVESLYANLEPEHYKDDDAPV